MFSPRKRKLSIAVIGVVAGGGLVGVALSPSAGAAATPRTNRSYTVTGSVAAGAPITVDVALPLRHEAELQALVTAQATPGSAQYHKWLTPQTFRQRYGVTDAQVASLRSRLAAQHVTVNAKGAQAVAITGTAAAVQRAFSTRFEKVRDKSGRTRTASATVMKAPEALAELGGTPVDITPAIRMHTNAQPKNRYGAYGPYWFDDLKQAYQYPAYGKPKNGKASGAGETIGILMSSAPNPADTTAYFQHEGAAAPTVTVENIDGGAPFSTDNDGSFEVNLDVQQSGGMAPNATINVYNIPDLSDESIFSGYVAIDEDNTVDVASSSFGGCELDYTAAYNDGTDETGILKSYNDLFMQGESQGITYIASSGDSGALGCTTSSYEHGASGTAFQLGVSFPADSPYVTAVGGTNLVTSYAKNKLTSKYVRENATADTEIPYDVYGLGTTVSGGYWGSGGGFSTVFKEPGYQKNNTSNTTGQRALPDVSLHMGGCPGGISLRCNPEDSADAESFGGQFVGVIGTSASAPDFAGTVALYNEVHGGRSGNINPVLYRLGKKQRNGSLKYQAFHQDIPGDNGYYQTGYTASQGTSTDYDEVIGNGTLIAKNFVFGTDQTPAAGNPQTPSNP